MPLNKRRNFFHVFGGTSQGYAVFIASLFVAAALDVLGVGIVPVFIALLADPARAYAWLQTNAPGAASLTSPDKIVWLGCWTLILLFPLKNAAAGVISWLQLRFVARREISLATRLMTATIARPYAFHLQHSSAELQRLIVRDSFAAIHSGVLPTAQIFSESLVVLFIVAALYWSQPLAALTATVFLSVFIIVFQRIFRKHLAVLGRRQMKTNADLVKSVTQSLRSIKEVKLLGRERYFTETFAHHARLQARDTMNFSIIGQSPRLILEALVIAFLGSAVLLVMYQGIPVNQSLPYLALFGMAAIRLLPSVSRILAALTAVRTSLPAIRGIAATLTEVYPLPSAAVEKDAPSTETNGTLAVNGLSFIYPAAAMPVLSGIDFEVRSGLMTGIVGSSGAGKSTLVDILLGLQTPTAGTVSLDGRDVAGFQTRWQRSIGYVPQSIYLLDDTIRANIAFGLAPPAINDAQVWQALEHAMLADFVRGLPDGLDTMAGEDGSHLSGGQRQRIGIARALYGGKSFLIMDEATSALDNQMENEVGKVLQGLKGSRTQIIVAHRLNTVKRCDWLLYLDQGRLADQGSYDELIRRNESFRRLMGEL